VIDFTAKWYAPSQHFLTQFVAMAEIYKGAAFCLVDIDLVKPVAESLGVNAPMFRLYRAGKQVAELSGLNVLGSMSLYWRIATDVSGIF
jgi:thioredoxin-like negative regulator of GroEL